MMSQVDQFIFMIELYEDRYRHTFFDIFTVILPKVKKIIQLVPLESMSKFID